MKQTGHSDSSQYCTSMKWQRTQGKKPPTTHRTTDVETSTFISIENRRVEEPIHFTTYRQPRGLNQGNKPLHLTPSHFRRQRNTRGHTLAGRPARWTRPLTGNVPAGSENPGLTGPTSQLPFNLGFQNFVHGRPSKTTDVTIGKRKICHWQAKRRP